MGHPQEQGEIRGRLDQIARRLGHQFGRSVRARQQPPQYKVWQGGTVELEAQKTLAELLRAAAMQTVPEEEFWAKFKRLVDPATEPVAALAYDSAIHYWGNFHQRNLLLIRVKPDQHQLRQGQNELNLIAEALESNWPVSALERKLKNI